MSALAFQLVTYIAALWIGYRLPDIDLAPVLPMRHRSAFTHGPLFALGLWWAAQIWPQYTMAFAFALAAITLHLLEDITPKKWRGSALINLAPLPGSLPAPLSWAFIGASMLLTALAVVLVVGRQI